MLFLVLEFDHVRGGVLLPPSEVADGISDAGKHFLENGFQEERQEVIEEEALLVEGLPWLVELLQDVLCRLDFVVEYLLLDEELDNSFERPAAALIACAAVHAGPPIL